MKKYVFIILLPFCATSMFATSAQPVPPPATDVIEVIETESEYIDDINAAEPDSQLVAGEVVYKVVDQMPSFPGGNQALFSYLQENLKYPAVAQANGIQGRTLVTFVVEKDGSITNAQVVRSAGDPSLDREAVRIIRTMPRWRPGKIQGQTVRVQYTVPINFKLQ